MESGSVLSEPVNSPAHRGFLAERSASMTIISPRGLSGQPRMSQLESLEAKMANIEVSLSSSNPARRRKGTSLSGSISSRASPRPESKELRSALQDREAVIQNLRIQLCLGKLPRPSGPPLDETERPAAEQKLARLKTEAENKRIAIRNLKGALDRLDITDNIDIRIRQAELEYALGREELQLLSIVEEARALQARLDKSKPEANTLYSIISSGISLSLHAVQATVGRWAATSKPEFPGLYVEWALDGEGLYRGDRILEVNGKIVTCRTREELQKFISTSGKCQLVVLRKKTAPIPHQQLIQQQEDNIRLQHRISYLEEQVREMQSVKEQRSTPPATINGNGNSSASGHVTSISISSPPSTPPDKPQVFQRGNYVTTLVGGKPIELTGNGGNGNGGGGNSEGSNRGGNGNFSKNHHVTKTLIKENGHLTDSENNYLPPMRSLSASKISINSDMHLHCHRREHHGGRDRYREKGLVRSNTKIHIDTGHHNHIGHCIRSNSHDHIIDKRKDLLHVENARKSGNDLRSVKSLDFDSDSTDHRRNIDYTSEPVAPRVRPTPPKKPLRLSLQRAQSLQTVELNIIQNDADRKRPLKRMHNGVKTFDNNNSLIENTSLLQTASLGRNKLI